MARSNSSGLALSGGDAQYPGAGRRDRDCSKGLRSELDALVTFRPDPRNPSLTGDIRVVQSAYTETITIAALARQAALPVMAPTVERPYLDRLRLNLAVTTTEDIIVDNNYGRLAAGANVRVIGTVAAARHGRPHHAARRRPDLPGRPHVPHHARRHFVHRSPPHPPRVQHRRRGEPRHRRRRQRDDDADRHARAADDRSDVRGRLDARPARSPPASSARPTPRPR